MKRLSPRCTAMCAGVLSRWGWSVSRRHFRDARHAQVSDEELRHLDQELPPRELLTELRSSDSAPDEDDEHTGRLRSLMPQGTHPLLCFNESTVKLLCGRYGVSAEDAVGALRDARGDINLATDLLEQRLDIGVSFGCFGLVCLESYDPETFCLVSYNLPNFAATRDDDTLDAIHELTLSAAEMPADIPSSHLRQTLMHEWTIEDGTSCRDILRDYNLTVGEIVLLPHGEYGANGFNVLCPVKEDAPNIGVAAAACCLDLRTGIHNRFRFHVERIADTVSEHVLQERVHYAHAAHILRQPYWFRPEYSVEELIRFKESLLQPSASTYEMRYAAVFAPQYNLPGFRNIVEMEKLRIAQHKHEKHYEDFTAPGNWLTSDNAQLQTVVAGGGGANAPGAAMHAGTNDGPAVTNAMETSAGPLRRTLERSMQTHGDRIFARFYRNNHH